MPYNSGITIKQDGVVVTSIDRSLPIEVIGQIEMDTSLNEYFHGYYDISFESTANNSGVLPGGTTNLWTDNSGSNWPGGPQNAPGYTFIDGNELYSPWTPVNYVTHIFPAGFFTANGTTRIRIRLRVWRQGYEPSLFDNGFVISPTLTVSIPGTAPTISSPAGTVMLKSQPVTINFATPQNAVQYRILNGAAIEYDSGTKTVLTSATNDTNAAVPFIVNGSSRTLQARTRNNTSGLWSAWVSKAVTVTWTPPAVPALSLVNAVDASGLGYNHAIAWSINNPAPTGTQPTVTSVDFYARKVGDVSNGVKIGSKVLTTGSTAGIRWFGPSNGTWQIRAVALADDLTNTTSTWTTAGGTLGIVGVLIHDPTDALLSLRAYPLNAGGAKEKREVESALLQYAGREYPVVEFGTSGSDSIDVQLSAEGLYPTANLMDDLKALVERRKVLCYRDKRGRVLYGLATLGDIDDTPWGKQASLTMIRTYATDAPPGDVT